MDAMMGTETSANSANYKTASVDSIPDKGGPCVQGTTEYGHAMADVHSEGHFAAVDAHGGYTIPCNSTLARKTVQIVQSEIRQ